MDFASISTAKPSQLLNLRFSIVELMTSVPNSIPFSKKKYSDLFVGIGSKAGGGSGGEFKTRSVGEFRVRDVRTGAKGYQKIS